MHLCREIASLEWRTSADYTGTGKYGAENVPAEEAAVWSNAFQRALPVGGGKAPNLVDR